MDDEHPDDEIATGTTTADDTDSADGPVDAPSSDAGHRPWYRRPRLLVPIAAFALLCVGAGVFAYLWASRGAEEASTQDVIDRYRREQSGGRGTAGLLRPAGGVYTYHATGTERLSILGTSQQWGPTVPATVTEDAGDCWTLRLDYSTNHWQEERYCPSGDVLLNVGGRGYQSFDFGAAKIGDTTVFICDPPSQAIRIAAEPGESWTRSCDGRSEGRRTQVTSAGTNTFVDIEQLTIGDEKVASLHYRLQRILSGDQTGTEDINDWYAVTDGLLLRSTRDTRVASPSPIGDVIYTEQGEFQLTSRTPLR